MVLDYSSFTCVGAVPRCCLYRFRESNQSKSWSWRGQKGRGRKNVRMNMMSMRRKSARVQNGDERRKRMQRISARNVRNAAGRSFWKILTVRGEKYKTYILRQRRPEDKDGSMYERYFRSLLTEGSPSFIV